MKLMLQHHRFLVEFPGAAIPQRNIKAPKQVLYKRPSSLVEEV